MISKDSIAFRDCLVFTGDAHAPLPDATIVLEGADIAAVGPRGSVAIPADAEILDCSGCTIVPGFWNSHVHFFERKWERAEKLPADELEAQLEDFTRYGFTTVFDLSSKLENTEELRARIKSGEVRGPRILSTGEGLVPPNALPPPDVMRVLGTMETPMPEVANATDACAAVRRLLDSDADGLKLFVSSQTGSKLDAESLRAAANAARAGSKPVFAHVNSTEDVRAAIDAGVDVVAHTTPMSGPWDTGTVLSMKHADVALTPTLSLWDFFLRHDRQRLRQAMVEMAVKQLHDWHRHGGRVLFGTDYGAVGADPSTEYALMREAGMEFADILASLTTAPAKQFGESERFGRIATGMAADLVVLEGDPSQNLLALTRVRYTVRSGKIVYRG